MPRPTRVLYVEDDPALRGVVTAMLSASPDLEVIAATAGSAEALGLDVSACDVALLDYALGPESLTGTELGLTLRQSNPHLGIVIFSQHVVPDFLSSLPEGLRWGWSFIEKRANVDPDSLVNVLRMTARGMNIVDPRISIARERAQGSLVELLTARQREVIALAATGMDATGIADELGLASTTVRQELSKVYAVLVPDPKPGTDLRTTAVLRYLRATRVGSELLP